MNKESDELYQQSLMYHILNSKEDTIYVFKDFEMKIPTKIKNTIIINIEDFSDFVKNKNEFYAIKILPIEVNKSCVDVSLVDFYVENKEGEINLINTGGESFTYCYNSKIKKHRLTARKKNII